MTKRILWASLILTAILVGIYPTTYFLIDRKFGLLNTKSDELLSNIIWNIGFYTHITLGGLALLIGWLQFNTKFRVKYLQLHRVIGKVYVVSVILSSISGFYIALSATGGIIAALGFVSLAILWLFTTLNAYKSIKNKQIVLHQKMMIYSYALCFAAVTLRIWLPILISILGDFTKAYIITAWLCWIPNFLIARNITSRL
jgi:uncharacterized membrane protein